ncbi:MAG: glycosyltransferase, partial [Gammaproteobacteria bacterium]|nr:glycosyltransferase [Gammaproteobacteria bacterium]
MSLRVYVFSDNRLPTQSVGGHGLGRLAHLTAEVLLDLGFTVTIWGSPGTEPALSNRKWSAVRTYQFEDEARESIRADLRERVVDFVIDMTHEHVLGKTDFDLPILHYIVDTECAYKPPNAVVCNAWQAQFFPGARILMPPVNDKMISFYSAPAEPLYLAYAAKIDHRKGYDIALEIHRRQSIPVHFVGDGVALENESVFWRRELLGRKFYDFIGLAGVLLSPSRLDAGGLVNLEAGACGTPVLVLENTGPAAYVEHGV